MPRRYHCRMTDMFVAVRDKRTVLWSLVLPICAICLVMLILKINIDPSTRTMLLDLSVPPQTDPISALNLPPSLAACSGSSLYTDRGSTCQGSYAFDARANGSDAYDMNKILLAVRLSSLRPIHAERLLCHLPYLEGATVQLLHALPQIQSRLILTIDLMQQSIRSDRLA